MSTGISWTDETYNPLRAVLGGDGAEGWHCERVSDGCKNCYAETLNMSQRFNLGTGLPYNRRWQR